jgi:hypothetical protein
MTVNPNQAELTSVYVRIGGGADVVEDSVPDNASVDIVFDLEAGTALFGLGPAYRLSVALNDLSASSATIFTGSQAGNLGDPHWSAPSTKFAFNIPAGTKINSALDGHVLQAIGVMAVGVSSPEVEAQQSELIVVVHP